MEKLLSDAIADYNGKTHHEGLSVRARNILNILSITDGFNYTELLKSEYKDFIKVRNCGRKTAIELLEFADYCIDNSSQEIVFALKDKKIKIICEIISVETTQ